MNLFEKATDYAWEVLMALTGLFFAYVWDTRKKIDAHELHVSENYVKKDDLKEMKEELIQRLDLVLKVVQPQRK